MLANKLHHLTLLELQEFQLELHHYLDNPLLTLQILADLITAQNMDQTQQNKAAIGFNWIIHKSISINNWQSFWEIYRDRILLCKPKWTHLRKTHQTMVDFFECFENDYGPIMNSVFTNLPFYSKIMAYDCTFDVEFSYDNLYLFLRQTLEEYLQNGLFFLCQIHQSTNKRQYLEIQELFMVSINQLLTKIFYDKQYFSLYKQLTANQILFNIIAECLLFDPQNQKYSIRQSHLKNEDISLMCKNKNCNQIQIINHIKSNALNIFTILLKEYSYQSTHNDFDEQIYLNLMQNLVPMVIKELLQLCSKGKIKWLLCYEEITISLFNLLRHSIKYIFLLDFYQKQMENIVVLIYEYLKINDEEIKDYEHDAQNFINNFQNIIQAGEDNRIFSIKNYCAAFIEDYSDYVDGSFNFIVEAMCDTILFCLRKISSNNFISFMSNSSVEPTIECSLTFLTIFSSQYSQRQDIVNIIFERVIVLPELKKLDSLDKARLLMFLTYNFEALFRNNGEGHEYLLMANETLEQNEVLTKCCTQLYSNCLEVGFGPQIWNVLVRSIKNTKYEDIIKLLNIIINRMLNKLPSQLLCDLIQKIIARLVLEYQYNLHTNSNHNISRGTPILYCCLNLLESITCNADYLQEEPNVILTMWPILDFLELSDHIEYQDNVIKIYNNFINAEQQLSEKYLIFTQHLRHIQQKYEGFKLLFKTYTYLLEKGKQLFHKEPQLFENLMVNILDYTNMRRQCNVKQVCILAHYAYLLYPNLIINHQQLQQQTMLIYQSHKQTLDCETIACLINLWIAASNIFDGYDLSMIDDHPITIFQAYQAKVFCVGIRTILQKGVNSISYVRYAIRLLHYLRENESNWKKKCKYINPKFERFIEIDPFQEIIEGLTQVRRQNLEQYQTLMKQLETQLPFHELKKLLSLRQVADGTLRTYHVLAPM